MLIHVSKEKQNVTPIDGDAHIVLTIRPDGGLHLQAYLLAEWNTRYANSKNTVVDQIPKLLAELREDLAAYKAADAAAKAALQASV